MVDLRHPSCRERRPGDRFLRRVLAEEEHGWLEEGGPEEHRPLRLWSLWAAKEAAFKVVSKLGVPPPVFRHRGFVCSLEVDEGRCRDVLCVRGLVRGPEVEDAYGPDGPPAVVAVEGTSDGEHVHLVGWPQARDAGTLEAPPLETGLEGSRERSTSLEDLRDLFSELEWEGIRTVAAAEARLRARDRLAGYLRRASGRPSPPRVEIVTSGERPGRTPPRIRVDGTDRPDLDLSLSHHGRFVAWALLVPLPSTADPGSATSSR